MERNDFKLNGSKTGTIHKKNFNMSNFKKVLISASVLFISSSLIYSAHNVKENRVIDRNINEAVISIEPGNTYSDEIERMLNVSIDDKYEDKINNLSDSLYIINNYEASDDALDKNNYKNELLDRYGEVQSDALYLLKKKIADENNLSVDEIKVMVGNDDTYATTFTTSDRIKLHGDDLRLANSISRFQGYNIESFKNNEDGYNRYMESMKNVITDSVKLVDNKKDYKLADYAEIVR